MRQLETAPTFAKSPCAPCGPPARQVSQPLLRLPVAEIEANNPYAIALSAKPAWRFNFPLSFGGVSTELERLFRIAYLSINNTEYAIRSKAITEMKHTHLIQYNSPRNDRC